MIDRVPFLYVSKDVRGSRFRHVTEVHAYGKLYRLYLPEVERQKLEMGSGHQYPKLPRSTNSMPAQVCATPVHVCVYHDRQTTQNRLWSSPNTRLRLSWGPVSGGKLRHSTTHQTNLYESSAGEEKFKGQQRGKDTHCADDITSKKYMANWRNSWLYIKPPFPPKKFLEVGIANC
jgi:hypothetical protein